MLVVYLETKISITLEIYSEKSRKDHRDRSHMAQRLFALWWWTCATASRCVYLNAESSDAFVLSNIVLNVARTTYS